jgi:hypothetical protein
MRKNLTVVLALLIVTAVASAAADNTIGTWKFDAAKSAQAPGLSPIKALTVVRKAASGGGVETTIKGEREDGSKVETSYIGKYDGKEITLTGAGLPYDTMTLTQVDANTVTDHRTKKGGSYVADGRYTVSKDGKTATLEVKGTGPDGKPFTSKSVYTRQ